jgi:hypothetical protein
VSLYDELEHWWALDEAASAATWADAAGNHDLARVDTVQSATGKIGTCYSMRLAAPQTGRLEATDNAIASLTLAAAVTSASICCWLKKVEVANEQYHGKRVGGATKEYLFGHHPTQGFKFFIHVGGGSEETITSGVPLVADTWYMLAVGYDVATNEIWMSVNGAAKTRQALVGNPPVGPAATPFRLGNPQPAAGIEWYGEIDEVGFWRRVLTDAEISRLYNGGAGLSYDDLAAAGGEAARIAAAKLDTGGL